MIHGFRIPDPTNGQSLVDLDFLGTIYPEQGLGFCHCSFGPSDTEKLLDP